MEVDFAFLCDYADLSGKINALGIGFDTIYAPDLPATHPRMDVVVQFRGSIAEAGRKALTVQVIDADGNAVSNVDTEIEIRSPDEGIESVARVCCMFSNVTYDHHGDYAVHIVVDGNEMKRIGFRVLGPPATS